MSKQYRNFANILQMTNLLTNDHACVLPRKKDEESNDVTGGQLMKINLKMEGN